MGEIIGAIERALGSGLNAIYQVIPMYGLAIVLLTLGVRALLIPLTVKQIKGFAAQQKVAPEVKKLQQKYRQMQQKAKDRAEVQALRVQMQKEMQELYAANGASMAGGCLPLLGQFPILIAMFAVMRASILVVPFVAQTVTGGPIPASTFSEKELKNTVCRPTQAPSTDGQTPTVISCPTVTGEQSFTIGDLRDRQDTNIKVESAPWISFCNPKKQSDDTITFECSSARGTGHLPRESSLFQDLSAEKADVFGMHAGCAANQAASPQRIRECTTSDQKGGVGTALPYYLLIGLVALTSYFQSKQMSARATGAQAQQQMMMTKIMPVVFGVISISFPAGSNVYFAAANLFTIVQQGVLFKRLAGPLGLPEPEVQATKPKKTPPSNGTGPKKAPGGTQKRKKRK